jgi:hypothetical protein
MASPARIEDLSKAMADINEVVRNRDSVDPGSGPEVSPEASPTRRLSRGTTIESWTSGRLPGPTAPARRMHSYRAGRRDSACDELRSSGRAERRAPEYDRADASKDHRDRQRRDLAVPPPGCFPSRDEYLRLDRWAPLIERPAYRFCSFLCSRSRRAAFVRSLSQIPLEPDGRTNSLPLSGDDWLQSPWGLEHGGDWT